MMLHYDARITRSTNQSGDVSIRSICERVSFGAACGQQQDHLEPDEQMHRRTRSHILFPSSSSALANGGATFEATKMTDRRY